MEMAHAELEYSIRHVANNIDTMMTRPSIISVFVLMAVIGGVAIVESTTTNSGAATEAPSNATTSSVGDENSTNVTSPVTSTLNDSSDGNITQIPVHNTTSQIPDVEMTQSSDLANSDSSTTSHVSSPGSSTQTPELEMTGSSELTTTMTSDDLDADGSTLQHDQENATSISPGTFAVSMASTNGITGGSTQTFEQPMTTSEMSNSPSGTTSPNYSGPASSNQPLDPQTTSDSGFSGHAATTTANYPSPDSITHDPDQGMATSSGVGNSVGSTASSTTNSASGTQTPDQAVTTHARTTGTRDPNPDGITQGITTFPGGESQASSEGTTSNSGVGNGDSTTTAGSSGDPETVKTSPIVGKKPIVKTEGQMKLDNTFVPELNNKSSPEYMEYKTQIENSLNMVFQDEFGEPFNRTEVTNLRNGSIAATFDVYFDEDIPALNEASNLVQNALVEAIDNGTLEELKIQADSVIVSQPEVVGPPTTSGYPVSASDRTTEKSETFNPAKRTSKPTSETDKTGAGEEVSARSNGITTSAGGTQSSVKRTSNSDATMGLLCFVCSAIGKNDSTCLGKQSKNDHHTKRCDPNQNCWITTLESDGIFHNFTRSCEFDICSENTNEADFVCLHTDGDKSMTKCTKCCSRDHCNDSEASGSDTLIQQSLFYVLLPIAITITMNT